LDRAALRGRAPLDRVLRFVRTLERNDTITFTRAIRAVASFHSLFGSSQCRTGQKKPDPYRIKRGYGHPCRVS
jgi:hypothetical protein